MRAHRTCMLSQSVGPTLSATLWTVACQAPLSMGFSRQEYWSVLPFPSPGDLPDPEIGPTSPALQGDSLLLSYRGSLLTISVGPQQVFLLCIKVVYMCQSQPPSLSPPPFSLGNHKSFSMSVTLFLFCKCTHL